MTSLHFVLSASAAQKVHEAVACLSKFSEYICLEARRNRLTFSALNSSRSAYGAIALSSFQFFGSYQFFAPQGEGHGVAADPETSRFTCRLYSKALLAAFRQRYFDTKDKGFAIEKCEVSLEDDPSRPECRLLVKLICRHGVLKTYKLVYEEVEVMAPVFDKDRALNRWTIHARLFKEYMEHFGPKAEHLDISSDNGRASFTSFTEKVVDGKEILKHPMQTNIAFDTSEFQDWTSEDRLHIAISLKDMKAIVNHAGSLNTALSTFYSEAGRPLQVAYEDDGMRCEFTLMTMHDVRASQAFAAITRVEARPTPRPNATQVGGNSGFAISQRDPSESQQPPSNDNEGFNRPPIQSYQARPSASAQRTQPQPSPPSPSQVLPSQRMTQGLFLPYESEEEDSDDDLGKGLDDWDEAMVRWDSGRSGRMPSISVVRDQIAPQMRDFRGDTTESEEEKEEEGPVVGPTQEVSQARGLFDF